jgi:hypothetical protein
MQIAQPVTLRLTVHELSGLPGQSRIREPIDFPASAHAVDAFVQRSAYCIGAGPNGSNVTKLFWMHPDQASAFDSAVRAALSDHYTVTLWPSPSA